MSRTIESLCFFSLVVHQFGRVEFRIFVVVFFRQAHQGRKNNIFFVSGVDDIVRVWNVSDGELRLKNKLTDHSLGVVAVDINKEATKAVSSSLDSTIHLWDLQSGERIRKIDNGPMESWTVAFSPDGKHIISGAQNGKVHFFDTETGQKEQQMDTRGKFVLSIAYVSLELIVLILFLLLKFTVLARNLHCTLTFTILLFE